MTDVRLFVEKKKEYQEGSLDVLGIHSSTYRHIIVYDVFNCDADTLEMAKKSIFQEEVVDNLFLELDIDGYTVIAFEAIDGQYDQRADSAMQCIKLLNPKSQAIVKTATVILLDVLKDDDIKRLKSYFINPVEMQEKDLNHFGLKKNVSVKPMKSYEGFIECEDLEHLYEGFAMSFEDLKYIQTYFKGIGRNPTETEIKVLDTYWSDHCRHTTFNTRIDTVEFEDFGLRTAIEKAFDSYLKDTHKPLTLMDIATVNARLAKQAGDTVIEESDEVNACSIIIDVEGEEWLLMFKNETHNHPTEIEPFGGASTCIGGAIRDPLSGRAYVYQAMRISGCGDVLEDVRATLPNKLPQSVIARRATDGYSSYGNQIGLTTTYVHEIYHSSYVAKHLECGAVVGAVKRSDVVRGTPAPGDIIILLGGRTGRDGIGGATGSSVAHKESSLTQSAAEVQKGNAIEERKIQRLFRNPAVTRLIKRSNDFGAGGVSVAIGELADGLDIQLDKVRLKYEGLNPTEIAISESQERMAVVVEAQDVEAFIAYAHQENLEAYDVATVTDTQKLIMRYGDEIVVELDREFLNSSGVQQVRSALIKDKGGKYPFGPLCDISAQSIQDLAGSLIHGSQKGLIERFDGSIGATTLLMPLSGKTQCSQNAASVQKIPVLDGKTDTCSMLSYGFIPEISEYSPFLGGQYAIVESISKTVCQGGDYSKAYLSLQEYFPRPGQDDAKWGNVLQALLGAYTAQKGLGLVAIGGKDSMSGSYQDLDVVDTLISFACSPQSTQTVISSALKREDSYLYLIPCAQHDDATIDFETQKKHYERIHQLIQEKTIISGYTVDRGNAILAVLNMALGNDIGVHLEAEAGFLCNRLSGSIVVESVEKINDATWVCIGHTQTEPAFIVNGIRCDLKDAHLNALDSVYPLRKHRDENEDLWKPKDKTSEVLGETAETVRVLIPVFPGNNCEYDTARAFEEAGAVTEFALFNNLSAPDIEASIDHLAEAISRSHILAIPGGFSAGDEPDGSAKFIVNVLNNPKIKQAISEHLKKKRLILGICNGFQALIKSGLLPYGIIGDAKEMTLFRNDCGHHVSTMVHTVVASRKSPWLKNMTLGDVHTLPISHGEGKIVGDRAFIEHCHREGCVAFQYCDERGVPSMDAAVNPNGSLFAIEGLVSFDGLVLGKMAHSERVGQGTFIDFDCEMQGIFKNGVDYFREEK